MRITIDIDDAVLIELKRLQQREGKSLGRLVSDLLTRSLAEERSGAAETASFHWASRAMLPLVDLCDKDALREAFDKP